MVEFVKNLKENISAEEFDNIIKEFGKPDII